MPRILKLSIYLAITVPLMGSGPGCVSSQVSLADRDQGFIDSALLGSWGTEGDEFDLAFTATLDEGGDLALTMPVGSVFSERDVVYTGYSSTLGGHRYLNARFETCSDCDPVYLEDETKCPHYSLRYAFDLTDLGVPPDLKEETESDLDDIEWFRRDRTRLFLAFMESEIVESAIESGAIEGIIEGNSESPDVCITDTQEMLREFVESPDAQASYTDVIMPFVRLTPDDVRELNEIRVEFGILQRSGGVIERTTTIPLSLCEDFRFGFDITTSNRISYDYQVIHELPEMPITFKGDVLDPGPPVRFQGSSDTERGSRNLGFSFDEGDPTGAYRAELYINGELSTGINYTVVEPENPDECESP